MGVINSPSIRVYIFEWWDTIQMAESNTQDN